MKWFLGLGLSGVPSVEVFKVVDCWVEGVEGLWASRVSGVRVGVGVGCFGCRVWRAGFRMWGLRVKGVNSNSW